MNRAEEKQDHTWQEKLTAEAGPGQWQKRHPFWVLTWIEGGSLVTETDPTLTSIP